MKNEAYNLRDKSTNESLNKSIENCICRKSISFLLLVIIAAAIFVHPVAAEGAPVKLIVFTDKNVYSDWYIDNGQTAANTVVFKADNTPAQTPYIYAIVLDKDGNMVKGQTVSVNIKDIARLDHFNKGVDTTHHARTNTNGAFFNVNANLYDNGASGDKDGSDGIYSYQWTPSSRPGTTLLDDHLMVNITVTSGSLSANATILFSSINCHKEENRPPIHQHIHYIKVVTRKTHVQCAMSDMNIFMKINRILFRK